MPRVLPVGPGTGIARSGGAEQFSIVQRMAGAIALRFAKIAHPGTGGKGTSPRSYMLLPGTLRNYGQLVGDPWTNSAVYNCLAYITSNVIQPKFKVTEQGPNTQNKAKWNHGLTKILRSPNGEYSGKILLQATALDFKVWGTSYWEKERDNLGRLTKLWWRPYWTITPQWPGDGSQFISHYSYRPDTNSKGIDIAKGDIVHFRNCLNPRNPRMGLAPSVAILRDIFGDNAAGNIEASLLDNQALPGLLFSPKSADVVISPEAAQELREYIETNFSGDDIGKPMAPPYPVDVERLSLSPEEMTLRTLHVGYEERIAGAMGLPPIVASLGAGLSQTNYSQYETAVQFAYLNCLSPMLDVFADTYDDQLLYEFGDKDRWDCTYDLSEVPALLEYHARNFARISPAVKVGWMSLAEARQKAGLPWDASHEVFLRPDNVSAVKNASENPAPRATQGTGNMPPAKDEDEEEATIRKLIAEELMGMRNRGELVGANGRH